MSHGTGYMPGRAGAKAWALIDRLIAAGGSTPDKAQFSGTPNYGSSEPHVYPINSSCWAAELDLTCAAAWQAGTNYLYGLLAISPLHVLATTHASPPGTWPTLYADPPGYAVDWVTRGGDTVTRKISAEVVINGSGGTSSVKVCKLASALPDTIKPAKVLPVDYRDLTGMPITAGDYLALPRVWLDRPRFAPEPTPHGSRWINIANGAHYSVDLWDIPAAYVGPATIDGDSGTQEFIFFDPGEPVFMRGPSFSEPMDSPSFNYRTAINAAMTTLGGVYQLSEVDLRSHCGKWS